MPKLKLAAVNMIRQFRVQVMMIVLRLMAMIRILARVMFVSRHQSDSSDNSSMIWMRVCSLYAGCVDEPVV